MVTVRKLRGVDSRNRGKAFGIEYGTFASSRVEPEFALIMGRKIVIEVRAVRDARLRVFMVPEGLTSKTKTWVS